MDEQLKEIALRAWNEGANAGDPRTGEEIIADFAARFLAALPKPEPVPVNCWWKDSEFQIDDPETHAYEAQMKVGDEFELSAAYYITDKFRVVSIDDNGDYTLENIDPMPLYTAPPIQSAQAPDWRGYAALGTGQYLLNACPATNDLPAELVISVATEEEKVGRFIGDLKEVAPGTELNPDAMAVRLAFFNADGLDALEQQLRILREESFPETNPTPHPAALADDVVRDAERYRWLRDSENQLTEDDPCVSDSFFNSWFGEELDKVIDEMIDRNKAAIAAAKGEK